MEQRQDNKRIFQESLTAFLADFGFKHSKRTWWKKSEDGIFQLIEYQPSKSGDYFFLNLGVYVEGLTTSTKIPPKSEDWHLWVRFERFLKLSTPEWNAMSDLHESIDNKILVIQEKLRRFILPAMGNLFGYPNLARALAENEGLSPFVVQNIRRAELETHVREMTSRDDSSQSD